LLILLKLPVMTKMVGMMLVHLILANEEQKAVLAKIRNIEIIVKGVLVLPNVVLVMPKGVLVLPNVVLVMPKGVLVLPNVVLVMPNAVLVTRPIVLVTRPIVPTGRPIVPVMLTVVLELQNDVIRVVVGFVRNTGKSVIAKSTGGFVRAGGVLGWGLGLVAGVVRVGGQELSALLGRRTIIFVIVDNSIVQKGITIVPVMPNVALIIRTVVLVMPNVVPAMRPIVPAMRPIVLVTRPIVPTGRPIVLIGKFIVLVMKLSVLLMVVFLK